MEAKYELTDETIEWECITLYRIKALRDFGDVKAGDLGGFVESEDNLSDYGNCWIYNNARVCEGSTIEDDAKISNNAWVTGCSCVCDNARVYGHAKVFGGSTISDQSRVFLHACVEDSTVTDQSRVYGHAIISECWLSDNARVYGYTELYNDQYVDGNSDLCDHPEMDSGIWI